MKRVLAELIKYANSNSEPAWNILYRAKELLYFVYASNPREAAIRLKVIKLILNLQHMTIVIIKVRKQQTKKLFACSRVNR